MGAWFDCTECVFASNSPKAAHKHETETGHKIDEEAD